MNAPWLNGWQRLFFFTCALWLGFLLLAFCFFNGHPPQVWAEVDGLWRAFIWPMGILFAIGHGVAWVRKGFRKP